ncbi:tigger transposable element-derived protein 4-like [Anneissia japonica]|uniref:tigger transposable element-derived protein 4-like n=1 Tax=Anneissia japonica TaxID=1529436 RepID=UPI001425923F|nr:tigger transposable element-derived protein 4-like [Anneissia japonica]
MKTSRFYSKKRELSTKTYEEKYEILTFIETNPKMKRKDVAEKFNIKPNTLSCILKKKEDIIKIVEENSPVIGKLKRIKTTTFVDVDKALLAWFRQNAFIPRTLKVDGISLITKANEFARKFGHEQLINMSWIDRFKKRHGISKVYKTEGQAGVIQVAVKSVNECKEESPPIVKEILLNFEPWNIYSANETGLFWKMLPEESFGFLGQRHSVASQPKTRMTILVCTNMDGSDKVPLFVIGNIKEPRSFRELELPVYYKANSKASMTKDLFEAWLRKFDNEMRLQGRKVAMILHNCTAHSKLLKLENVKLYYLPPTSVTHPIDGGIILNLKHHYRKILCSKRLAAVNSDPLLFKWNILDAVISIKSAWERVTPTTICNAYKKVGFIYDKMATEQLVDDDDETVYHLEFPEDEINGDEESEEKEEMQNIWQKLGETFELPSLEDYVNIDDGVDVVEQHNDVNVVQLMTGVKDERSDEEDNGDQSISLLDVFKANDLIRKFNLRQGIDCPADIQEMSDRYERFLLQVSSKIK